MSFIDNLQFVFTGGGILFIVPLALFIISIKFNKERVEAQKEHYEKYHSDDFKEPTLNDIFLFLLIILFALGLFMSVVFTIFDLLK